MGSKIDAGPVVRPTTPSSATSRPPAPPWLSRHPASNVSEGDATKTRTTSARCGAVLGASKASTSPWVERWWAGIRHGVPDIINPFAARGQQRRDPRRRRLPFERLKVDAVASRIAVASELGRDLSG